MFPNLAFPNLQEYSLFMEFQKTYDYLTKRKNPNKKQINQHFNSIKNIKLLTSDKTPARTSAYLRIYTRKFTVCKHTNVTTYKTKFPLRQLRKTFKVPTSANARAYRSF